MQRHRKVPLSAAGEMSHSAFPRQRWKSRQCEVYQKDSGSGPRWAEVRNLAEDYVRHPNLC